MLTEAGFFRSVWELERQEVYGCLKNMLRFFGSMRLLNSRGCHIIMFFLEPWSCPCVKGKQSPALATFPWDRDPMGQLGPRYLDAKEKLFDPSVEFTYSQAPGASAMLLWGPLKWYSRIASNFLKRYRKLWKVVEGSILIYPLLDGGYVQTSFFLGLLDHTMSQNPKIYQKGPKGHQDDGILVDVFGGNFPTVSCKFYGMVFDVFLWYLLFSHDVGSLLPSYLSVAFNVQVDVGIDRVLHQIKDVGAG